MDLREKLKGKFIVLDGPDGSGKGTQLMILREYLESQGIQVEGAIDPGGTAIGDKIRKLVKYGSKGITANTEVMLFMASRAQLVTEVIKPALTSGKTVLCDRFISSTCAYQGASGYSIDTILELGQAAIGDTWPDLTIILDLPAEIGRQRAGVERSKPVGDHYEQSHLFDSPIADYFDSRSLKYHRKVRTIFRNLAGKYPRRIEVLDVKDDTIDVVSEKIRAILSETEF